MKNIVYVVHCADTEGPLYESIEGTFERIRQVFNIDIETPIIIPDIKAAARYFYVIRNAFNNIPKLPFSKDTYWSSRDQ